MYRYIVENCCIEDAGETTPFSLLFAEAPPGHLA